MSDEKVAHRVRDVSAKFHGTAIVYHLDPPLHWGGLYDGDEEGETEYVVASAAIAPFSGPETYIFPCDKAGNVVDWGELPGSFRGGLDPDTAIRNAGYELADD